MRQCADAVESLAEDLSVARQSLYEVTGQRNKLVSESANKQQVIEDVYALTVEAKEYTGERPLRNIINQIAHYCRRDTSPKTGFERTCAKCGKQYGGLGVPYCPECLDSVNPAENTVARD